MQRVFIKPLAKSDLDSLWDFIAEDNPEKATEVLISIQMKLEMLAKMPLIGRERKELSLGLRSFPIKKHIVFYRPVSDGIEVIRFLHGSQDIDLVAFED